MSMDIFIVVCNMYLPIIQIWNKFEAFLFCGLNQDSIYGRSFSTLLYHRYSYLHIHITFGRALSINYMYINFNTNVHVALNQTIWFNSNWKHIRAIGIWTMLQRSNIIMQTTMDTDLHSFAYSKDTQKFEVKFRDKKYFVLRGKFFF